ncbi:MAG: ankyrin repeat domain-containing protein, partial [Flavobacteriaceae bacterium]
MNSQNEVFEIARHGCTEDLQDIMKISPEAINFKNKSGFTPLILASYHGNLEVATFLAKHVENINVNSDSGTALMAAVFKNDIEITKMLLNLGA